MKRIIIASIIFIFMTDANAAAWTGLVHIEMLYINGNWDTTGVVFVKTEEAVTVNDGCDDVSHYVLKFNNNAFKEIYSALLTASSSKAGVNLLIGGCSDNGIYPKINHLKYFP